MKTLSAICLIFTFSANAQLSMQDIEIGSTQELVDELVIEYIATSNSGFKCKTDNGNHLSVTLQKGKVVYLENDWLQQPEGKQPLITDFTFGETSLKDIRETFGTNGFTHLEMYYVQTETHLVMFNCFEVDSPRNEILVAVTKISLQEDVDESNVAEKLLLDALILSDAKYLEKIWGRRNRLIRIIKKLNCRTFQLFQDSYCNRKFRFLLHKVLFVIF